MPLRIENLSARVVVVIVICSTPALVVWNYITTRDAFSALSAANILLVEKVEKFDEDVAWSTIDQTLNNAIVISEQTAQFETDTRNRKANMDNWAASAAQTRDEVSKIHAELDALSERLEVLAQTILADVDSAKRNTAATREQAVHATQKLNQKVLTGTDAEELRKQAETLKQQNRDLRKKKAKPIFKLFLNLGKADH